MSRVEILFNGPVTLEVQHFRDKLDRLIEVNEKANQELYSRGKMLQADLKRPPM